MKNTKDIAEDNMAPDYGFEINTKNFIQVGENRFFEITGSIESLDKFLKDNGLFQESV